MHSAAELSPIGESHRAAGSRRRHPAVSPEPPEPPGRPARSGLIGRETELATLLGLLYDPTVRILTITGAAGVGKSRLARAAAAQRSPLGHDLSATVDLSSCDNADDAWRRIAGVLDAPLAEWDRADADRLAEHIGDRAVLLLLDNCDLVASGLSLGIAHLSAYCPGLRVVLTSRVSLDIYDERLFPLRPLPAAAPGSSHLANPESPAVRLFVERVRAQRPDYSLLDDDLEIITEVCVALDGLPLAIELSAGAVAMLGPRALLTRLRDGEWPASSRLLDLPARHRTVTACLSWGDRVLSPEHRRFLQQLCVCQGTFDIATAQHLTGLDLGTIMSNLETLVHMSLLQRSEQPGGDVTFRMLSMIRSYYLHHQQMDAGELARVRDRHAAHFAGAAAAAAEQLHGPDQGQRLTAIRLRLDDYRAAVAHLQSRGDHPAAARMLVSTSTALEDCHHLPESLSRLLEAIRGLESTPRRDDGDHRPLLARALETAGAWSLAAGDLPGAGDLLRRAAVQWQGLHDRPGAARVAAHLAETARLAGDPLSATALATTAVAELDLLGERRAAVTARRTLALAEAARDQPHAEAHLLHAVEEARKVCGRRALAAALTDLARLLLDAGRPGQAHTAVREAMELLRGTGGPRHLARALETAARVLPHLGKGQQHRAARLLLATGAMRARHGLPQPEDAPQLEKLMTRMRVSLGDGTLTELRRQVHHTSPMAALNDALSAPPTALRASPPEDKDVLRVLTPRQTQIARMVADGLTNRQIAHALDLSEWTVINHLRQVMQKLDCPSRVHVACLVQQATS
ncbi:hypothetical protein GCM10009716_15020 [Streptomyces sodiiphilus]|uniref:HTH luxR-type domain-containing protein n=1 Tax=Streptomyces sodiiphilus TaxID=226217 RepID=A0ABN2NY30_9ACTN